MGRAVGRVGGGVDGAAVPHECGRKRVLLEVRAEGPVKPAPCARIWRQAWPGAAVAPRSSTPRGSRLAGEPDRDGDGDGEDEREDRGERTVRDLGTGGGVGGPRAEAVAETIATPLDGAVSMPKSCTTMPGR